MGDGDKKNKSSSPSPRKFPNSLHEFEALVVRIGLTFTGLYLFAEYVNAKTGFFKLFADLGDLLFK